MKGLLLLASWFLVAQVALSQSSTLLPVVQKGKWKLTDTSGKVVLETEYDFISLFDNLGTAIVRKNNLYGIINEQGKEITPISFRQVKQLNFGLYAIAEQKGWSIYKPKQGNDPLLKNLAALPKGLSENWVEFLRDSTPQLLNLSSSSIIDISDSTRIDWVFGEHLMLRKNGYYSFYNPDGRLIIADSLKIDWGYNYYFVQFNKLNWLVTASGEIKVPYQIKDVHGNYDGSLTLITAKDAKVVSLPKLDVLFQGPYADIYIYDEKYYEVTNFNNTINFVDKHTNKKLFPDKFVVINEMGNYYYAQDLNKNLYLLDSNRNVMLQGAFSSLYTDDKFIYTQINSWQGLYSCKTKKEILPCIFSRIEIKGLTIKAARPNALLALKLDKEHRIIDRMYMENPYNLQTVAPPKVNRPILDPRLKAMGWYIDSTEREDRDGNLFFTYAIGLKDGNDSIIRKPNLSNLNYLTSDFAIFKARPEAVKYHESHKTEVVFKQPILNRNGKTFMSPIIVDYDSTDFKSKSFMRISFIDKFGILTDTGSYLTYDYIQHEPGTYLVYCRDASIKPQTVSTEETFNVPNMYFSGNRSDYQKPYFGYQPNKHFVLYEKAKWNYLTPSGQALFPEDFDFAHPFVGSKAIAKQKGKWGVISSDTVIIPFVFDQIQRVIKDVDTFFICKTNTHGYLVLDSVLTAIPNTTNCFSSNGQLGIVEKNSKQVLMNSSYAELGDEQNYFKAHDNGFYTYKIKKDFFIIDETGNELGQTKVKVKQFLAERYGIFENGTKLGLVSMTGDTVLAPVYTSLEEIGKYILAQNSGGGSLFTLDLKPIFSYSSGKILIDPSTGLYAHVNDGKTTVYSITGKTYSKFKKLEASYLLNGKLIVLGKNALTIDVKTKQKDSIGNLIEVQLFPNGYLALRTDTKDYMLYDASWKLRFNTDSMVRKITYLGASTFEIRSKKNGLCVYNFENNTCLTGIDDVSGDMQTKRLLIKKGSYYYYIDDSLKRISNYNYKEAKPFVGNRAAVLDFDGWSLINPDNLLLSYPDFNELTVYSNYFIKAKNKAHYGLYNNTGSVVIPCAYEKLVFVNKKLVQTFLHGEVQYFRTSNGSIIR